MVAAAAREANSLIDQRTFSWTAFFNQIEATLPPDVMLVSVRPAVKDGATRVSLAVLGRTAEDIDEFIEKLEATGAFEYDPRHASRIATDDGLNRAVLDAVYTPDVAPRSQAPAGRAGPRRRRAGEACDQAAPRHRRVGPRSAGRREAP